MNYGYGFDSCGCDPCYPGYGYPTAVAGAYSPGCGNGFALIVVLFILLIIIGASFYHGKGHC